MENVKLLIDRTVKHIYFFIFLLWLFPIMSQAEVDNHISFQNIKVSINSVNQPVSILFEKLSDQSGLSFFYNEDILVGISHVTINVNSESLDKVLNEITKQTNLVFRQIDNTIAVSRITQSKTANPAQDIKVAGTVIDAETKEPLTGALIYIKDSSTGTTVDIEGNYSIRVSGENQILVVSFTGYVTQEVPVNGRSTINFELKTTSKEIDEVVVVGYGVQKKVSVVGAISTVKMKEIESVPAPSISQALVGKVPGLFSRQTSGEPGQDQAYLYIRGLSTWGDNTAIVIVDGVERDINSLNMPEIESISFLKDATATAVYGIRGANGVIVITTKKGQTGAPVVTLRSEFSQLHGMRFPDFISAGEMAELWNEALLNDGLTPFYKPEEIVKYYDGSDPYNYPNINWIREILKENTTQNINNLNIRGGTEKVHYFVNLGYTMQNGLFKTDPSFEYNTNVRLHRYSRRILYRTDQ